MNRKRGGSSYGCISKSIARRRAAEHTERRAVVLPRVNGTHIPSPIVTSSMNVISAACIPVQLEALVWALGFAHILDYAMQGAP